LFWGCNAARPKLPRGRLNVLKEFARESIAGEQFRKSSGLFPQAQFLEHALVAVVRSALEVVEHLASPGDHLEKAAARGMILDVRLQMIGELIDAVGQQSHLHVRAPCVFLVHPERMNILSVGHIVLFREPSSMEAKLRLASL
jgi:hypothetical protein